jgi:hypothetical protein
MHQCVEEYLYRHKMSKPTDRYEKARKILSAKKNLMDITACSFAQGALKNGRH